VAAVGQWLVPEASPGPVGVLSWQESTSGDDVPLLIVVAGFWAAAVALTRRCGARTRDGRLCRNRARGWFARCPEHPRHLLTLADFGAAVLALIGFLIITHSHLR
jgi:hypothetical protein